MPQPLCVCHQALRLSLLDISAACGHVTVADMQACKAFEKGTTSQGHLCNLDSIRSINRVCEHGYLVAQLLAHEATGRMHGSLMLLQPLLLAPYHTARPADENRK